MAKIKQSPKLPAEERRRQLIEAAHDLFMKKGYRDTSTEEIARRAGLTKGALYFHFNSKDDILFELVRQFHDELIGSIKGYEPDSARPGELLESLMKVRSHTSAPDILNYIDFWFQAHKIPKIRKYLEGCYDEYDRLVKSRLDRSYGSTPAARRDMSIMIAALFDGLILRSMMSPKSVNFRRQARLFNALVEGHKDETTKSKKR